MADALRRILWLIPVLAVGAVLLFFVLGSTSTIRRELDRPLFYNPRPQSAQTAALRAIELIEKQDSEGPHLLAELGGAALPVVLAEMPTMDIESRRRLALSLKPVADRMGLTNRVSFGALEGGGLSQAGSESGKESDRLLLFWERYRDEHALDLRPLSASRLVKRMAERDAQIRNADLLAIDTFALPTLVTALGRITTRADVERARRVVRMIAHVTGKSWNVPKGMGPAEARKLATEIRDYWDREGVKFTHLERLELLLARVTQTEFGAWVFRSARQLTGLDYSRLASNFLLYGRSSALLCLLCLLGLLVIGPATAATIQVVLLRTGRFQFERFGLRAALAGATMAAVASSIARPSWGFAHLAFISVLVGSVFSTFILQRELSDRIDWRTHHVLSERSRFDRIMAVTRWISPSIPTLIPIAIAEAVLWVMCLEMGSETPGLGRQTLLAARVGDLDFLMAICLGLGLTTGVAQVAADLFLGNVRTRLGER